MGDRNIALKAINLEFADRIPGWEFLSNPDFETQLTGIDAYQHPQKARIRTLQLLDIDAEIPPLTDDPPSVSFAEGESSKVDERGKQVVRWGAGQTWSWDHGHMFKTIDDVLRFEPLPFFLGGEQKVYFEDLAPLQQWLSLPVPEMARHIQNYQTSMNELVGESALVPGFYYRTLIMWPLMLFGWELFSELAYCHKEVFQRLWDDFAEISLKVTQAYAMTDIQAIMSHDDICYTQGPIFNPQWYRENLYPYYERIWAPLREKGIKIIFISDGNLDAVVDDVLGAGADGFLAEPTTNMELFAKRYREQAIMLGNVDSRILLMGDKDDIRKEVERCTKMGKECPGYFYCVSNHLAWNIPPDNIRYYFDCTKEMGRR